MQLKKQLNTSNKMYLTALINTHKNAGTLTQLLADLTVQQVQAIINAQISVYKLSLITSVNNNNTLKHFKRKLARLNTILIVVSK